MILNRIRCLLRARLSCELRDKTQLAPMIQTKLHLWKQFTSQQVVIDVKTDSYFYRYQGNMTSAIVSPFHGECSKNQYPPPP